MKKSILLILSILISFIIIEIFIRIFCPVDYFPFFTNSSKTWIGGEWLWGGIVPSNRLGYELKPNNIKYGVNSLGMFDKERTIKKDAGVFRILVFGDSTTANSQYTRILEEHLNSNNQFKFEVWNCGVPAYGTRQEIEYLKMKGLNYNPDMVIIGFSVNDFSVTPVVLKEANKISVYYPVKESAHYINPFFFIHSHFYRYILIKLKILIYSKNITPRTKFERISDYEYEVVCKSLQEAVAVLSAKNILFHVVIMPYLKKYPEEYDLNEIERYKAILYICNQSNITYLDLIEYFKNKNYSLDALRINYRDVIHQNYNGDKIIAERIFVYLKNILFKT